MNQKPWKSRAAVVIYRWFTTHWDHIAYACFFMPYFVVIYFFPPFLLVWAENGLCGVAALCCVTHCVTDFSTNSCRNSNNPTCKPSLTHWQLAFWTVPEFFSLLELKKIKIIINQKREEIRRYKLDYKVPGLLTFKVRAVIIYLVSTKRRKIVS